MASNKPRGDGKRTGLRTGLGVNVQFANALLHGLSFHNEADPLSHGQGVRLPIDENMWQQIFEKEFPNKPPCSDGHMQSLVRQCSYYNNGVHGLGYDKNGVFDFGRGDRDKHERRGSSVQGTPLAIRPGKTARISVDAAIRAAAAIWSKLSGDQNRLTDDPGRQILDQSRILEKEGYFSDRRAMREIAQRYGQPRFRARLLKAYECRCAITGCDCKWALEAAHISPYAEAVNYEIANGLLLRADIHTLFDMNLIGIHPQKLTVHLSAALNAAAYKEFEGKRLRLPKDIRYRPCKSVLNLRWNRFGAAVTRHETVDRGCGEANQMHW